MPSRVLPLVGFFTGLLLVLPLVAQEQAAPELSPLEQGRELFNKRQFAEAEQVLRVFITANAAHEDAAAASVLHGRALMRLNRADDARRSFDWVLSRHPRSTAVAAALEGLMQFHEHRGNATGAQDARRRLLSEHPESPVTARVWLPLANQAFEKSDFAQAATIYTALESGLDAVQKGQLHAARILSEGANDPVPVLESARASMREREHRAALALLRVLRERFPRHPAAMEAAVLEGQCLVHLGDRENAERARDIWQRVVSQTGVDEQVMDLARWELIRVHAGPLGDIDSALRWCREAIEGSREGEFRHQQAVYSKAWLLWVHKRYEAALAAFEAFERAYPTEAATAPIQEYMQDCRDKIAK